MGWEIPVSIGTEDFECPIEPLPLVYVADVDFIRFSHPGGGLCLAVDPRLGGTARPTDLTDDSAARFNCPTDIEVPVWESAVYKLTADGRCIEGDYLNPKDGNLPLALGIRGPTVFIPDAPPGRYGIFLAPVCGRYFDAPPCSPKFASNPKLECVPYDFSVAVALSEEACRPLSEQLDDWKR